MSEDALRIVWSNLTWFVWRDEISGGYGWTAFTRTLARLSASWPPLLRTNYSALCRQDGWELGRTLFQDLLFLLGTRLYHTLGFTCCWCSQACQHHQSDPHPVLGPPALESQGYCWRYSDPISESKRSASPCPRQSVLGACYCMPSSASTLE